jgi:hypothetical protein
MNKNVLTTMAESPNGTELVAATLEGWHRSPLSQAWIDHATAVEGTSKSKFDAFLAQNVEVNGVPVSEGQRADLF